MSDLNALLEHVEGALVDSGCNLPSADFWRTLDRKMWRCDLIDMKDCEPEHLAIGIGATPSDALRVAALDLYARSGRDILTDFLAKETTR